MADPNQKKAAAVVVLTLGVGAAVMLGLFFSSSGSPGAFATASSSLPQQGQPQRPGQPESGTGPEAAKPSPEAEEERQEPDVNMPQPTELPQPVDVNSPDGARETGNPETTPKGPAGWPSGLPFPENSRLIEEDLNGHARYVLSTPTGISNTGGAVVAALEKNGWDVNVVGTLRSATITARRGKESLGVSLRDQSSPEGPLTYWDLVYQQQPPPIPDPTPSPSDSLQRRA